MKFILNAIIRTTVCASVLLVCGTAGAIDIDEVRWGFDGKAMQHRFNLLSILVSNHTAEAFDGGIALRRTMPGRGSVGALLRQPLFLSPHSQKWIQFHPFVNESYIEWKLLWGPGPDLKDWGRDGEQRYDLNKPTLGKRAYVILHEPGALIRGGSGLKDLPDNLFPPTVTATDTLEGIVLDHTPRWQKPTRKAFGDWLHAGGTLHILRGDDTKYPQFSEELTELNLPLPIQFVGQGMVFRHEFSRSELSKEDIAERILDAGRSKPKLDRDVEIQRGAQGNPQSQGDVFQPDGGWNLDDDVLTKLKKMTQPEHSWWLIYSMSFVYLLLIFPGGYLLGRRRVDYRLMIAALIGTIALFSVGFAVVGSRGYGESTTVNSIAIARPLPGGEYDVTGWSNAFVTAGDDYLIQHGGTGRIYSTCQSFEGVKGAIQDGREGKFLVDIPPFSARTFGFRTKLSGQSLGLKVEKFSFDGGLRELELSLGPNFPQESVQAYALIGDAIHNLARQDGKLIASARGQSIDRFLKMGDYNSYNIYQTWRGTGRIEESGDQLFDSTFTPLMIRSLNISNSMDGQKFWLPGERARIFIFAPMPEEFHLQTDRLGKQNGRVLYCVDVFKDA